jgi:xylan 1,4-beta-xylosidase
VTLRWDRVPGAIGYLVHRGADRDGPFAPIDHGGGDVLAVPGEAYADTAVQPGQPAWYAVAAVGDVDHPGPLSPPVRAAPHPGTGDPPVVRVAVHADRRAGHLRRVWHMLGSERLSQLGEAEASGGRPIGAEFADALRLAHDELGVTRVRAHAILHDDLGVYPRFDFSRVDDVYDRLLGLGLRPVVELSFMPRALARDPQATVFDYGAIVSPPGDWDRWAELNARLAAHLVGRYGIDDVARWGFEVWNEANLEVFWTGDQADYLTLYERAARAVKSVDDRLLVGGPATAAAGWIADFLDAVQARDLPLDFLSTHTYGNLPLDLRQALAVRGMDHVEVWWTEWGVTPTHFALVTDGPFGAPFVLHGMKAAQESADALAYWVVSDHFEELGRPPALLHGGFGLLTVGNLRKPRWWALRLAQELDDDLCEVRLDGDGAGSLVDAWASRAPDGRVDLLVWNGTLDQSKAAGDERLTRRLAVRVAGLAEAPYSVTVARVDAGHSNLAARWHGRRPWPDDGEWAALHAEDRLATESLGPLSPRDGSVALTLDLPMPGVLRLRLEPS